MSCIMSNIKIASKVAIHKTALASVGAGLLALCISLPSQAQPDDYYDDYNPRHDQNNFKHDYANVVRVQPIYQTYTHRVPQETCWSETVRREHPAPPQHRSATGTIVGGIIGGAIGHAVGHGSSNKKIGAAVGSVLGMSVGNDVSRRKQQNYDHYRGSQVSYDDVERCDVNYRTETEEKVVGYDVTYAYRGDTYNTRMQEHPGERIKVAVSVQPVSNY